MGEMVRSLEAVVAVSLGVVGSSGVVSGRSLCHARMCSSSRRARRRYSRSSRASVISSVVSQTAMASRGTDMLSLMWWLCI